MRNKVSRIALLLFLFVLFIPGSLTAAEIVNKITVIRIIGQDDFTWAPDQDMYCRNVAVSQDGQKVVFRARLGQYPDSAYTGYDFPFLYRGY